MTPEGKVKKLLKNMLSMIGSDVYVFWPMSEVDRGIPDLVGCVCGKFFAVECKAPGGRVKGIQKIKHIMIKAAGGKVFVVENRDGIDEVFNWINWVRLK